MREHNKINSPQFSDIESDHSKIVERLENISAQVEILKQETSELINNQPPKRPFKPSGLEPNRFIYVKNAALEYYRTIDHCDNQHSELHKIASKYQLSALHILSHVENFEREERKIRKILRDRQITRLFRSGLNNREISEIIGCSPQTIYNVKRDLKLTRKQIL